MLVELAAINWFSVALATLAFSVLGGVYFSVVVPRFYVIALGRESAPKYKMTSLDFAGPMICSFVISITIAILIRALNLETLASALLFGVIVGLGFLIPMTFMIAINPNFPRPILYGLINSPYFLVGSVIASVVLVLMR